ncbi:Cytoplasmic tRNA 2-thiolation protein 2 [Trichoderma lentiforme]|uniref:Cytoplasmic tRNA 2-thiolation protein 2 n=1 Tax=Trichoderma lentiforme TaxID=1567552 RepID=A0A9P5CH31_9HYPO|nr:Cytoplasmic tRNA 2-thiolation protein 2 [Trichoderma lentiforme]
MAGSQTPSRPCMRCKKPDAAFELRNVATCQDCFIDYVDSKAVKRFTVLQRETRTSTKPEPRRYVAGLSFGPSSTVLTQILDKTAQYHASRKGSSPFEPLIVHIDTDLSARTDSQDTPAQRLLAKYRERFPNVSFECVHLSKVLSVKTIDWTTIPVPQGGNDAERLQLFFSSLPSVTSRADSLRLFIRHLLLDVAIQRSYSALLFGHSTTALAALTLSEVANGRGFAVPWQINDGLFTVCTYRSSADPASSTSTGEASREDAKIQFPIYYPLREILKAEVMTYLGTTPAVQELIPSADGASSSVVSHKDQSIEEVMARYFDGVEGPYSGIVTNVVRTAGKLDRLVSSHYCRLCGITLDQEGDSTWAGELGDDLTQDAVNPDTGKLCYGCKRSMGG